MLRANFKTWLGSLPEWGSILLLFLTLEIAIRSIEQAQWITPQPSLTVVLALAVLASWLLAKSRLPSMATPFLALVLGVTVTIWQASKLFSPSETVPRVNQLIMALQSWWQAINAAKPSEGTIHFAVFLIFFTWLIGYVPTWFASRRQNIWVAVCLGTVTILVNLSNLPEQRYIFFFLYLLAAIVLVGYTNLAKHCGWLEKRSVNYSKQGIIYFTGSILSLGVLVLSLSWLTPEIRAYPVENLISSRVAWGKNVEEYLTNLLAAVPAKQPSLKSREQEALFFGDSAFSHRDDRVHFIILSKQPRYWRMRAYDTYNSWGWASSNATEHALWQGDLHAYAERSSNRNEITFTVIPRLRTDMLLTTGEFISSDILASAKMLAPLSFDIDLLAPFSNPSWPADITSLLQTLRVAQAEKREFNLSQFREFLPGNLTLISVATTPYRPIERLNVTPAIVLDGVPLNTLQVARNGTGIGNTMAVTTPHLLRPGHRYTVTASVFSGTPDALARADDDYPYWVTDYYLQLPSTLPDRVRQFSEAITEGAKSAYDKAVVIKNYLAQFRYTAEIKAPPQGADGVDYFLFTQQSGNCVNFASATVVMLRSVGVPSRLGSGYSPGDWEQAIGGFKVANKHRHAWAEIYFPGYGWVEFETTPAVNEEAEEPLVTAGGGEDSPPGDEWVEWLEGDFGGGNLGVRGARATYQRWGLALFWGIIVGLLLVFNLKSVFSLWLTHLTGPNYASKVYGRICFLASLNRLSPKPQQTPFEFCAKLALVFPLQAEALHRIAEGYLESRFSPRKELEPLQREGVYRSWRMVYPALLNRLFRIRRARTYTH